MGISLILGGSEPLPGWFGALMQWKLKLKWAFACVKEGVKACQDALWTYVPSKRWFGKFAEIGPEKKCPRVPVWVRVVGCNRYLGNAQIEVTLNSVGLPLPLTIRVFTTLQSDPRDLWPLRHLIRGIMTIFVTWQLIVTLDSIRNSCDVYTLKQGQNMQNSLFAYFSSKSGKHHFKGMIA